MTIAAIRAVVESTCLKLISVSSKLTVSVVTVINSIISKQSWSSQVALRLGWLLSLAVLAPPFEKYLSVCEAKSQCLIYISFSSPCW